MADFDGEKSQDPTPHRREEAKKQGQIARSQDFSVAVLLLTGLCGLLMLGGPLVQFFFDYTRELLGGEAWLVADQQSLIHHWSGTSLLLAKVLLPILGMVLLAALAVNFMQVGFLFLPEKVSPDLTRIDPMKGFSRIFSLSNVVHLLFGILKIVLILSVAYSCLWNKKEAILGLTNLALPEIAEYTSDLVVWTSIKIAAALLLLALFDYGFQWWKHEQDLKMTPQEVREEMKNLEGNPQIISRRKQVQRQLAMNRMAADIPKADVVITNPTELAIAIQYKPEEMAAPIVVAKGAGLVAARIRRIALEHGVPILEKKPLAQALYREVEINHPIPQDKYAAVAEVLAYVYQLKGKTIPVPKRA